MEGQEAQVHKVEIYHRIASTGYYYAACSCGVKSAESPDGRTAWKWIRQFHPEGHPQENGSMDR